MLKKDMRDYVAWDTETTDKFPDDAPLEEAPYIIQLACVKYVNDVEIGTFETLIRLPTGVHSSEGAVAVHGITDALVMRDGISFDDAWRKFRDFVGEHTTLVAHNNAFDERVLRANLKRFGHDASFLDERKLLCTWLLRREKMFRDGKLTQIYEEFFNKPLDAAHDALNDSRGVGMIYPILRDYRRVLRDIGVKEVVVNASDIEVACAQFKGRSSADQLVRTLWFKYKPETCPHTRDDDILRKHASIIDEVSAIQDDRPAAVLKRPKYGHISVYDRHVIQRHVTLQRWKRIPKPKFPGVVENTRTFRHHLCTIEGTRYYIAGRPYGFQNTQDGKRCIVWPKYRTHGLEGARDGELLTAQLYMGIVAGCRQVRIYEIHAGAIKPLEAIESNPTQWENIRRGAKNFAEYFHNTLSTDGLKI